jgi:hypothetical protein
MGRSSKRIIGVFPIHSILESLDGPVGSTIHAVLSMQNSAESLPSTLFFLARSLLVAPRIPNPEMLNMLLYGLRSNATANDIDKFLLQLKICEDQILQRFNDVALTLRDPQEYNESAPVRGTKISNEEIELVCAFLSGVISFLGALRSLVPAASHLRDHRAVTTLFK